MSIHKIFCTKTCSKQSQKVTVNGLLLYDPGGLLSEFLAGLLQSAFWKKSIYKYSATSIVKLIFIEHTVLKSLTAPKDIVLFGQYVPMTANIWSGGSSS